MQRTIGWRLGSGVVALMLSITATSEATVFTAMQDGAFNAPATWGESALFPGNGDTANIGAPYTITAGANAIASGTTVNITGAGKLQASTTTAFSGSGTTASVNLANGGTLELITATGDTYLGALTVAAGGGTVKAVPGNATSGFRPSTISVNGQLDFVAQLYATRRWEVGNSSTIWTVASSGTVACSVLSGTHILLDGSVSSDWDGSVDVKKRVQIADKDRPIFPSPLHIRIAALGSLYYPPTTLSITGTLSGSGLIEMVRSGAALNMSGLVKPGDTAESVGTLSVTNIGTGLRATIAATATYVVDVVDTDANWDCLSHFSNSDAYRLEIADGAKLIVNLPSPASAAALNAPIIISNRPIDGTFDGNIQWANAGGWSDLDVVYDTTAIRVQGNYTRRLLGTVVTFY